MRQLGFTKIADRLVQNKDLLKQFLIEHEWTTADLTGHHWFTNKWGIACYGPQTDDRLIDTKGVEITNGVLIGTFDRLGGATGPYIWCSEDDFKIYKWE